MKSTTSYLDYENKQKILHKIISNIIMHPTQDKYKKINTQSKLFNDIYKDPNCMQFIKTIGFVEQGNDHIVFRETNSLLVEAKKLLS